MYVCHLPPDTQLCGIDLKPVMRWHTAITQIKNIGPNEGVSYGLKFVSPCEMRIGTPAVGYGDGYNRCLSARRTSGAGNARVRSSPSAWIR